MHVRVYLRVPCHCKCTKIVLTTGCGIAAPILLPFVCQLWRYNMTFIIVDTTKWSKLSTLKDGYNSERWHPWYFFAMASIAVNLLHMSITTDNFCLWISLYPGWLFGRTTANVEAKANAGLGSKWVMPSPAYETFKNAGNRHLFLSFIILYLTEIRFSQKIHYHIYKFFESRTLVTKISWFAIFKNGSLMLWMYDRISSD